MNAEQRAALRLDIAARLYAVPRSPEEPGWAMWDALKAAEDMIRSNEKFQGALPQPGTLSPGVRQRLLDLALEVRKSGDDFQIAHVLQAFEALRIEAGISTEEIDNHEPWPF